MREPGRHVFRAAGNGGRRPLGQREGVIPGGSPGRRMQARGYIVGSTAGRHRRRPEANGRAAPSGTASSRDRRSPLRMEDGTPGSFGLSANRRNLGGLREFADSRWGRHW